MLYPAQAMPPETPERLSIYPVSQQTLKIPVTPEESTDPHIAPAFDLQYHVRRESDRLRAEKHNRICPPPTPTTPDSEKMMKLGQTIGHQNDEKKPDGDTTPREKTTNTWNVLHESIEWGDLASPEDSDTDFSMFDGTPRDPSILPEREEWRLPPWDTVEPEDAPPPTDLSSMTEWGPSLDPDFQNEARENLEKWSDFRFKVPQTPTDIESLQQALEMTRMDFWIRNPHEKYPDDLSRFQGESYASQQRRLQHAFCRNWQHFRSTSPPELYRLPDWMFGFEECYWQPSSWGFDRLSNAYNQCLAEMAAEKKGRGLWGLDYRQWKDRLKEPLMAAAA